MKRGIPVLLLTTAMVVAVSSATAPTGLAYGGYDDCGPEGCDAGYCDAGYCDGGYCGDGFGGGHCGAGGGIHSWRGPCYWYSGNSGCDLTCPCYGGCNCGCCDAGYMLPVKRAQWYNWNRNYAYTDFGQPTVLVAPPTANMQTNYGWGVASSRISRIDHQFQRNYPGPGSFGGPFRPTPVWPSDTTQFGLYYVRGPW